MQYDVEVDGQVQAPRALPGGERGNCVCPKGQYQQRKGYWFKCVSCDMGSFKDIIGPDNCTLCPSLKQTSPYTRYRGSISIKDCNPNPQELLLINEKQLLEETQQRKHLENQRNLVINLSVGTVGALLVGVLIGVVNFNRQRCHHSMRHLFLRRYVWVQSSGEAPAKQPGSRITSCQT